MSKSVTRLAAGTIGVNVDPGTNAGSYKITVSIGPVEVLWIRTWTSSTALPTPGLTLTPYHAVDGTLIRDCVRSPTLPFVIDNLPLNGARWVVVWAWGLENANATLITDSGDYDAQAGGSSSSSSSSSSSLSSSSSSSSSSSKSSSSSSSSS